MAEPVVLPGDELERLSLFFPIKLVNGFVTCDFRLGCYCCKFCLNRRYPDWQRLLEGKKRYRNSLQVEQAAQLLSQMKAMTRARITLKLGHDTDMSLEELEAQQLFRLIPPGHPVAFMRRGRLEAQYRDFYLEERPNLLIELTITPRSQHLEYTIDPFAILESFAGVRCKVFYTVAPVCHDNLEEARAILRALPPRSHVWVKDLIVKDIPDYASTASAPQLAEPLREYAAELGHSVINYINCLVRSGVGLGFHKRGEFVSEPNVWQMRWSEQCPARLLCDLERPMTEEIGLIEEALLELGLSLHRSPTRFAFKSYEVWVNEDVNFGDEAYLRELTGLKVDLYKPGRKTGTAISQAIADRWRHTHFFPVDDLIGLARDSYQLAFGHDPRF